MRETVLAIIRFQNKFFFIKRQNHLRAFPGYTSFPGGKVDRGETLEQAMVRELEEELNFKISPRRLQCIGYALAPDFNPYRFKANYFYINLDEKPSFEIDETEISEFYWLEIDEFLKSYQNGDHLVIPPMLRICDYFINSEVGEKDFSLIVGDNFVPMIETIFALKQIMPKSLTVPPAERTNAFLIGDMLVDPSPANEEELGLFINTIDKFLIKKIMLTHHHGDHHQFAPDIAKKLNVPILLSADTRERIENLNINYFKNISLIEIGDGEELTTWLGEKVWSLAIPGHDEGHLGIYPDSKKWFIAGDLFQGIGTVVVGGKEGDMIKYFESLHKVIDLNPSCVIPSHGIALGGVNILKKTLEHRKVREKQVLEMHQNGFDLNKMFKHIYFDLPKKLEKYAKANIQSHLDKLKTEGKI